MEPGDRILAVNGEDVKEAPRDHVIQLVRSCETQVNLLVCQPAMTSCPGRKSTLLSAGKRAKLRTRPSRVRFAESVCVNGAPLFPVSGQIIILFPLNTFSKSRMEFCESNHRVLTYKTYLLWFGVYVDFFQRCVCEFFIFMKLYFLFLYLF